MDELVAGRAWVFGDNVTTDEILPSKWKTKSIDMGELSKHAFEPLRPEICTSIKTGDMVVGGRNFGFGSSREQAALAIRGLGVQVVIAESFARIFYRNCINVGLYPIDGISSKNLIRDMDNISVHFDTHRIVNKEKAFTMEFAPLPTFMKYIVEAGGLIEFAKSRTDGNSPFS